MSVRFGGALRELRIHLCQTGEHSKGVRDFITKHYVQIKNDNPKIPILIRECNGVQPRIWARFDRGCEKTESLVNRSAEDVVAVINAMTNVQLI